MMKLNGLFVGFVMCFAALLSLMGEQHIGPASPAELEGAIGGDCFLCGSFGGCLDSACTALGNGQWSKCTGTNQASALCKNPAKGKSGGDMCSTNTPQLCQTCINYTNAGCNQGGGAPSTNNVDTVCTLGGNSCTQ
jgi:hypothetical protein